VKITKLLLAPNKNSLLLAVLWTGIILFLSFKAPSVNPKFIFPNQDKVVHFMFYFVFVFLWFGYFIYKKKSTNQTLIFLVMCSITMGILIELAQGYFTINRQADFYDVLANSSGSLVAFLLMRKKNH
jgi:VanZ family protein